MGRQRRFPKDPQGTFSLGNSLFFHRRNVQRVTFDMYKHYLSPIWQKRDYERFDSSLQSFACKVANFAQLTATLLVSFS